MTMSPPNNLKQKRNSKKYRVSRIPNSDYKKAEERWEIEDLQKEMDEAEPVDIDSIPMIYGDAKQDPNVEDTHNKMSYEPGQLGGKRKRKHKHTRKTRKNKSYHKRGGSKRSYRKSHSNKTHNTRKGKKLNKKTKTFKRRTSRCKK
jgi:hypothetical protein